MLKYFASRDKQIENNRYMLKKYKIPTIEVNYQVSINTAATTIITK